MNIKNISKYIFITSFIFLSSCKTLEILSDNKNQNYEYEEFEQAIEYLDQAIKLKQDMFSYSKRSDAKLELDDCEGALSDALKALEVDGRNIGLNYPLDEANIEAGRSDA